jgi:hypothetical protein
MISLNKLILNNCRSVLVMMCKISEWQRSTNWKQPGTKTTDNPVDITHVDSSCELWADLNTSHWHQQQQTDNYLLSSTSPSGRKSRMTRVSHLLEGKRSYCHEEGELSRPERFRDPPSLPSNWKVLGPTQSPIQLILSRPERFWDPTSLVSNWRRRIPLRDKAGGGTHHPGPFLEGLRVSRKTLSTVVVVQTEISTHTLPIWKKCQYSGY